MGGLKYNRNAKAERLSVLLIVLTSFTFGTVISLGNTPQAWIFLGFGLAAIFLAGRLYLRTIKDWPRYVANAL
jgi:hypothetical protein